MKRVPLVRTKLVLALMRVSIATLFNVSAVRSFKMTAKSKSTELGVKTVARLNIAINAEDAEAGEDVHYHTSCHTKHTNDARAAKSKSSHAKRGSPVGCSYEPFGNRSACRVCGVQSFYLQA